MRYNFAKEMRDALERWGSARTRDLAMFNSPFAPHLGHQRGLC